MRPVARERHSWMSARAPLPERTKVTSTGCGVLARSARGLPSHFTSGMVEGTRIDFRQQLVHRVAVCPYERLAAMVDAARAR